MREILNFFMRFVFSLIQNESACPIWQLKEIQVGVEPFCWCQGLANVC